MLPSTGYFKAIICPFYESGLCERPYCHFRHVKKDSQSVSNENGTILQHLIAETVKKVLQQSDLAGTSSAQQIFNADNLLSGTLSNVQPTTSKATYNPTPISELKKVNGEAEASEQIAEQKRRHIPVPYTPRKPASLPIKRPIDTNGSTKPFIYIPPKVDYTPGSTENIILDPYLPKGTIESVDKYHPGSEVKLQVYSPAETNTSNKINYVPSDKSDTKKKKLLEYKPTKVSSQTEILKVTYQPTPLAQVPCFSSDEEESDAKKIKLSKDLDNLDGLEDEFQILDEILHEEKQIHSKTEKDTKIVRDNLKEGNKTETVRKVHIESKNDKRVKEDKNIEKPVLDKHEHSKQSKDSKKTSKDTKRSDRHNSKSKDKDYKDKKKNEKCSKNSEDKSSKGHKHSSKHSSDDSKKSNNAKGEFKEEEKRRDKRKHDKEKDKHSSRKKHKNDKSENKSKIVINENDELDHVDEEIIDDIVLESDEEDIALECRKIFEEYVPTKKNKDVENIIKNDNITEEYIPTKKRISRTDKNIKIIPKAPVKPDFKGNAAQTMSYRLAKIKEFHALRQAKVNMNVVSTTEAQINQCNSTSSNTKIRIAHVPYASTLVTAKKTMSVNKIDINNDPSTSKTITQSLKKGAQRLAHIPSEKFIDRPGVLEPLASKIPANVRSTYLNKMIDESLKIYLSATDAYARAQQEELNTSKKCSTVSIYKNSAVLTINRLRKEFLECNGQKKLSSDSQAFSQVPASVQVNQGSWSIESKNRKANDNALQFIGAKFYNNISKWILSEEQLQENGFPRPHLSGEKGRAQIYVQNNKQIPPKGYIRTCCRCKKEYTVDKKGLPVTKEECIHHPNNKYRFRGEVRYQCCSQDGTTDGCAIAPNHVSEYIDYENLRGYVTTLPPERVMADYGVYALDCEMCYTTHGLDLTRVTVIDSSCKVVYETLIKPLHPIVDYNTRYSGITEEHMINVSTTLLDVQATLLSMFNSKTILIGHSLESDFKALKLIHDSVIDTSVLFPHKMGPPHKRALRNLSSEYLKKIIQNSVDGHDSAEDATVCMELIHYRLKEELKTR